MTAPENEDELAKILRAQKDGDLVEIEPDGQLRLVDSQGSRTGKAVMLHDPKGEFRAERAS